MNSSTRSLSSSRVYSVPAMRFSVPSSLVLISRSVLRVSTRHAVQQKTSIPRLTHSKLRWTKASQSNLSDTRQKLLENFDAEVHEKLKLNQKESQAYLDSYERWLWDVTRYYLGDNASFAENEYSFTLKTNPFPNEAIDSGPYKIGKNVEDAHVYRPGHSLAQKILLEVKNKQLSF